MNNTITFVTFDDSFEGAISDSLELIWKTFEEKKFQFAPIYNEREAGFICDWQDYSLLRNCSSEAALIELIMNNQPIITRRNIEDLYDWEYNELSDVGKCVLIGTLGVDAAQDILDENLTGLRRKVVPILNSISELYHEQAYHMSYSIMHNSIDVILQRAPNHGQLIRIIQNLTGKPVFWFEMPAHVAAPPKHYDVPTEKSWVTLVNLVHENIYAVYNQNRCWEFVSKLEDPVNAPYDEVAAEYQKLEIELADLEAKGEITEEEMLEHLHLTVVEMYDDHYKDWDDYFPFPLIPNWK